MVATPPERARILSRVRLTQAGEHLFPAGAWKEPRGTVISTPTAGPVRPHPIVARRGGTDRAVSRRS